MRLLPLVRVVLSSGSLTFRRSYRPPCDWKTSTHFPFSYVLRLAMCVRFNIRVCFPRSSSQELLNAHSRMILFKVPLVIPTRALWLVLLFVVGILGFTGQVCHPLSVFLPVPHRLTRNMTREDTLDDGSST